MSTNSPANSFDVTFITTDSIETVSFSPKIRTERVLLLIMYLYTISFSSKIRIERASLMIMCSYIMWNCIPSQGYYMSPDKGEEEYEEAEEKLDKKEQQVAAMITF